MKTHLKAELEAALNAWLDKAAARKSSDWEYYIHHQLVDQMADAAEAVFDSAQHAQEFMKEEENSRGPG